MISLRSSVVVVIAACLTPACSLDTEQFAFQDAAEVAGRGGAAGGAGSPGGGAAGTPGGGSAGLGGSEAQMGGGAGVAGAGAGGEAGSAQGGDGGTTSAGAGGVGGAGGAGGVAGLGGQGGDAGGGGVGGGAGAGGQGGAAGVGGAPAKACTSDNFGEQRCNDKTIETCDGKDWQPDPAPCPIACIDSGVLAACKVCEPQTATCTGNRLDICSSDGRGSDPTKELRCGESPGTEDLPVCNATTGFCQQCKPGEKICVGATSRTCGAGGVYPVSGGEECASAALCSSAGCAPPFCAAGSSICEGGAARFCKGDFTAYGEPEACEVGTSCAPGKGCVACTEDDGTRFCEGDTLTVCNGGRKTVEAECAKGQCSASLQKCLACIDGAFQCNGDVLSVCKNAEFVIDKTCGGGTFCNSVAGGCVECSPGSVRCSGLARQACNASGTFETVETCEKICDATGNECDECVPGASRCVGAERQICNDRGKYELAELCATAELCDAPNKACGAPECPAGAKRCVTGRQPQQCNAGRTDWENAGPACSGACLDFDGDPEQGCVATQAVIAGPSGSCAIVGKSGRVVCWGAVAGGLPRIPGLRRDLGGVKDLSLGSTFACALNTKGVVSCWGSNAAGQLARDPLTLTTSPSALEIPLPPGTAVSVSAVGTGACATMATGDVYCWGLAINTSTSSHVPTVVTSPRSMGVLGGGGLTRCAITSGAGARAYCWGDDVAGKLGNGTPVTDENTISTPVLAPSQLTTLVPLSNVTTVAVGSSHACATTNEGAPGASNVFCWGSNAKGALGLGTVDGSDHPRAVAVALSAEQVGAGNTHSCGLTATGSVLCWGSSDVGAHGSSAAGVPTPKAVNVTQVSDLGVGGNHTCALTKGNDIFCWGSNTQTQLGSVLPSGNFSPAPVKVSMP